VSWGVPEASGNERTVAQARERRGTGVCGEWGRLATTVERSSRQQLRRCRQRGVRAEYPRRSSSNAEGWLIDSGSDRSGSSARTRRRSSPTTGTDRTSRRTRRRVRAGRGRAGRHAGRTRRRSDAGDVAARASARRGSGSRPGRSAIAARHTEDRRANFDIYLPQWLAGTTRRSSGRCTSQEWFPLQCGG